MYTNADSLKNKIHELEVRVRDKDPMIIGITEVKPKNCKYDMNESEYTLDDSGNYNIFSKNLNNKSSRGLVMYVKNNLKAMEIEIPICFNENLFLEIAINSKEKLLIGLVYRSDSGSDSNNDNLNELITHACTMKYSRLLIMGDFNMPLIDWENWHTPGCSTHTKEFKFVQCFQDFS